MIKPRHLPDQIHAAPFEPVNLSRTTAGEAGADTFGFSAGESGDAGSGEYDKIKDFELGNDTLDLAGTATVRADTLVSVDVASAATGNDLANPFAITASVSGGVISLDGDDAGEVDTLAEWVAVARLLATSASEAIAFGFGDSTYVFQENGLDDLLVKIEGMTPVALGVVADASAVLIA